MYLFCLSLSLLTKKVLEGRAFCLVSFTQSPAPGTMRTESTPEVLTD